MNLFRTWTWSRYDARAADESTVNQILEGYAAAAPELIDRFEAVSSAELYADVIHLLPEAGSRVLDIGPGTGRDAGWLAARGSRVLAVEPRRVAARGRSATAPVAEHRVARRFASCPRSCAELRFRRSAASVQALDRKAGVTWTWLAFSLVGGVA